MNTGIITDHGTLESSEQALVKDINNAVSDADDLISNVATTSADEFAQARTKLEARLSQAKSRLMDASTAVGEKARCTLDATDKYVSDNPWKVLGVAAAAGVVIGAILSRR